MFVKHRMVSLLHLMMLKQVTESEMILTMILVAMNLSEMEAKVREATNNEPWTASSTLMSQIAAGTYNYREREEILSFIFRRFTEKSANEWRQIYKSLQLLEYLIKHGSERIIDDVRANVSLIQMLKSFHYIDSKGRDQGINVRNRAKNLLALLNDDNMIRTERKKARNNAHKFTGISSSTVGGASSVDPNAQFRLDEDYSNRVFGDGGVFGQRYGDSGSEYNNGSSNENFEEYEVEAPRHSSKPTVESSRVNAEPGSKSSTTKDKTDLLQDLVSFDAVSANGKGSAPPDDDDEFDDFQEAPSVTNTGTSSASNNLSNTLASLYQSQPTQMYQSQPTQLYQGQPTQMYPQSANFIPQTQSTPATFSTQPQSTSTANYRVNTSYSAGGAPAKKQSNDADAFSSLFSTAVSKTHNASNNKGPNNTKNTPVTESAGNDDIFGDFSANPSTAANSKTQSHQAPAKNTEEVDLLSF